MYSVPLLTSSEHLYHGAEVCFFFRSDWADETDRLESPLENQCITLASGKTTGGYLTQVRILRHPRALSSPLPRVTLIMNATREEHGEAKHERAAI